MEAKKKAAADAKLESRKQDLKDGAIAADHTA